MKFDPVPFKEFTLRRLDTIYFWFNLGKQEYMTDAYNSFLEMVSGIYRIYQLTPEDMDYILKVNNAVHETYMTLMKSI